MDHGTAFAALDLATPERFQRLRHELGVTGFGLNLMRLQPGQQGRIHRHEAQEEVYLVLEGELTLATGPDDERVLGRWELARVGPEVRRRLLNRGAEPCAVLAIGGSGEHQGRDGVAYESWEATDGRPPQEVALPQDLPPAGPAA